MALPSPLPATSSLPFSGLGLSLGTGRESSDLKSCSQLPSLHPCLTTVCGGRKSICQREEAPSYPESPPSDLVLWSVNTVYLGGSLWAVRRAELDMSVLPAQLGSSSLLLTGLKSPGPPAPDMHFRCYSDPPHPNAASPDSELPEFLLCFSLFLPPSCLYLLSPVRG